MSLSLELLLILRSADCTQSGGEGFTLSAKVIPPRWRIVEDSLAVLSAGRCRWEGRNSRLGASLVRVQCGSWLWSVEGLVVVVWCGSGLGGLFVLVG